MNLELTGKTALGGTTIEAQRAEAASRLSARAERDARRHLRSRLLSGIGARLVPHGRVHHCRRRRDSPGCICSAF